MAMNQLSPVCLIVGLYSALLAGRLFIMDRAGQPAGGPVSPLYRFPLATALLALAISVPTTLQFFFPVVLSALRRDYARFLAGDVVGFAWQPIGAGNSVGNFSLAVSMASLCLLSSASRKTLVFALLALGADALLLVLKDIHGAAAAAGILLAVVLTSPASFHRSSPETE
jgi:hypothetical protein